MKRSQAGLSSETLCRDSCYPEHPPCHPLPPLSLTAWRGQGRGPRWPAQLPLLLAAFRAVLSPADKMYCLRLLVCPGMYLNGDPESGQELGFVQETFLGLAWPGVMLIVRPGWEQGGSTAGGTCLCSLLCKPIGSLPSAACVLASWSPHRERGLRLVHASQGLC